MGTHLARGRASHHSSWREGTGSEPLGLSGSSAVKTLNDGSTHSSLFSKHLPGGLTEAWWGGVFRRAGGASLVAQAWGRGSAAITGKTRNRHPSPNPQPSQQPHPDPSPLRSKILSFGESSKGRGHKDVPSHEGRADAAVRARSQSRARPLEQCHQQDAFIPNAHQAERLLRGRGGAGAGRP